MALQLPLGYISMFLPTDSQIIEIGRRVIDEKCAEYADAVYYIDMYDSTFEDRLAELVPAIEVKNQFLVITSRYPNARGNGFSRGVSGGSGDYWYPSGAVEIINSGGGLEEVLGYYRDLVLYRGGKGGKGGDKTNWSMREFFVSSKIEKDKVICTVSLLDEAVKKDLLALKLGLAAANSLKAKSRKTILSDAPVARKSREPLSAKDKGKGLTVEEQPVCWRDKCVNKGKANKGIVIKDILDREKVDRADSRVTRSQNRVLEVNARKKAIYDTLRSHAIGKCCERTVDRRLVTSSEDDCDFGEDGDENKSKVGDDSSEKEGKDDSENDCEVGDMWINKGKGDDPDRGKVDRTDVRVTRSQTRLKFLEVKGKERVTPSDDERDDDSVWDSDDDSFDNSEFRQNEGGDDSDDGEDGSEKEGEDDSVNSSEVSEDDGEEDIKGELDYVDSVDGSVYSTVCNPPTEATRERVGANTSEANDMTTTEYYNQE